MLTYIKGNTTEYTIRTQPFSTTANYLLLSLQNMMTNTTTNKLLSGSQFGVQTYESFVSFSLNLDTITSNAPEGSQYRATLTPAVSQSGQSISYLDPVWHGSFEFFTSQSLEKTAYINQIPLSGSVTSHTSSNDYIIY